jgi:SAM-dependent methyltransferase
LSLLSLLTPVRRRGVEILDDPSTPADVRTKAMADLIRSNMLFGGTGAVLRAVRGISALLPRNPIVLDVGTGLGEIPDRVRSDLSASGSRPIVVGVDESEPVVRAAQSRLGKVLVGDARRLPVKNAAADLVTCSQLLHHFEHDAARAVLAELHRVSRGWIVVADLRRSWLAAAGFWLASTVLGFHPVTRHDGVVSVFRGFTVPELEALVREATGATPVMRRGIFWRVSATWKAGA